MIIEQLDDGTGIAEQQPGGGRRIVRGPNGVRTFHRLAGADRTNRFAVQDIAEKCRGLRQIGHANGYVAVVVNARGMATERHADHDQQYQH